MSTEMERRHSRAKRKQRTPAPSGWNANFSFGNQHSPSDSIDAVLSQTSGRRSGPSQPPHSSTHTTSLPSPAEDEAIDIPNNAVVRSKSFEPWTRRLSRRISVAVPAVNVSDTWQTLRRISRTEPSHETHFPSSKAFPPDAAGTRVTMSIYGIVDSFVHDDHTGTEMRLLVNRGLRQAHVPVEKAAKHTRKAYELAPSALRNGDWLCNPTAGPYSANAGMAMVCRGEIQRFEIKCRIVGFFPISVFGPQPPETYDMEMLVF